MLRTYYQLTKPGIIRGNLITTVAGFLLASKGNIHFYVLLATVIGTSLIIASGCVFNNYLDRHIDARMSRTKKRALVTGEISGRQANTFASLLGIAGFLVLAMYTNSLTVLAGMIGLFFYVVVYGFFKRRSVHGTLIGGVSGAMPPVAGYVAASNHLDTGAVVLFVVLVCWQMPHFYAIAIYRLRDYKTAKIPILSVKKGIDRTKNEIVVYLALYLIAASLLTITGITGYVYLSVTLAIGAWWLYSGFSGLFSEVNNDKWARKMFGISLLVLMVFSLMISLDAYLP